MMSHSSVSWGSQEELHRPLPFAFTFFVGVGSGEVCSRHEIADSPNEVQKTAGGIDYI